jgi:hypothetical protein
MALEGEYEAAVTHINKAIRLSGSAAVLGAV